MSLSRHSCFTLLLFLAPFGCGKHDSGNPDGGTVMPGPKTVDPAPLTADLLSKIKGYQGWMKFAENPTPKQSQGHGGAFVVAYHNDVVQQAVDSQTLPLPDGAIIVKDNLAKATDTMPMAITVMSKQNGQWYWVEATPEGKVAVDDMVDKGKPLEGAAVKLCLGCHGTQKDANDYIFTHKFKTGPKTVDPAPLTADLLGKIKGYQGWAKFAENMTPKLSQGHGGVYVLAHYNDVVQQAIDKKMLPLADGAIIVKDNFAMATDQTPAALTIMSKQNGAWYWVEATPAGKVVLDDAGKPLEGLGVTACTECHGMKKDTNDWIWTHDFTK